MSVEFGYFATKACRVVLLLMLIKCLEFISRLILSQLTYTPFLQVTLIKHGDFPPNR